MEEVSLVSSTPLRPQPKAPWGKLSPALAAATMFFHHPGSLWDAVKEIHTGSPETVSSATGKI